MLLEPPRFLDRQEQLDLIASHADALRADPAYLRVLAVLGFGGMGKTSLLEAVRSDQLAAHPRDQLVWVSLEGEGSTNSTGPLLALRDQLDNECLLFDTALLAYWNAMGQPLQLGRSGRLANSLVVKSLELGGGAAGFILPLGFGITVFESLKRLAVKRYRYEPDEFEEIEQLHRQPRVLLERLPYYLGVDLKRSLESTGRCFLAFYDAYDRQKPSTREASAPWMRLFIGTIARGVHIISTREPLRWDSAGWSDVVTPVPVEALPEEHARAMVSARLGDLQPDISDRLVSAARSVPFLLDTVIAGYAELAKGGGSLRVDSLPSSPDTAVRQLLAHLPEPQRELATALATSQVFDEELFRSVVSALNVQVSYQSFRGFVDWYFVEPLASGLYKTHDLLTAFVRESASEERLRVAALDAATTHLLERCHGEDGPNPDRVLPILRAVIAGWYSTPGMQTRSVETLVDVGFALYDAGYWNELASLGSERSADEDHPAGVLLEFFLALTARRILGVEPALERFATLMQRSHSLGRQERAAALEAAYVSGLAGDYARARADFRRIAESTVPFDPSDRTHVRARMYQGGMLLMDGAFRQSSRLLLETYDAVNPHETADWGELVRYRGHSHRFSLALEQAEELYLRAMGSTAHGRAPALLGRLHTNLAETYCWFDPCRALEAAHTAETIHAALGNRIELAKCDAARGIALAKLGEFAKARDATARALLRADEVGYQGGVAFALQATVVAEWLAQDRDAAIRACRQLSDTVGRMGTYRHLLMIPFVLLGDTDLTRIVASAEWLNEEPVDTLVAAYLTVP